MMWERLDRDSNVSTALGFVFFYIFYRTVVLNYRKQKKDYEDRLKIEKAKGDEKRKIRELEKEMAEIEDDDGDEEVGAKGEENPYSVMAKQFMKSGARVRRVQNKRLPQYLERGEDVKFTDVVGLKKIRLELEEIVKFFTHGEMYRRRGVKIPGGILLCGTPGVGKTLLAKALAGEAGVNFFSISASRFVEIYVGVGVSRVRALYQEARENAPSVVFIDELDDVGRERSLIKGSGGQERRGEVITIASTNRPDILDPALVRHGRFDRKIYIPKPGLIGRVEILKERERSLIKGSGGQERDATLNQLLVCLDGFEGRGEVITIASTNRPDILDPALVRHGRFDRKIYIPKPGLIGRVEILKVLVDDISKSWKGIGLCTIENGPHEIEGGNVEAISVEGQKTTMQTKYTLKAKIKESMEKAFWDVVVESVKQNKPDYTRVVELKRYVFVLISGFGLIQGQLRAEVRKLHHVCEAQLVERIRTVKVG
ncbi:ATP-dependent zinc metalloprotease ftsh [Phtheirospermum japonicum]|uniref:ATP-dependent zinc metalloprotease ftsh n=1 Tax=Phtheirospermum japonicum TaxID=374723 RepID=A0A830B9I3_9LAMI|nr:ATP-dependent zinc metalloprotease ftsh [Phtheirospermum japonicum]